MISTPKKIYDDAMRHGYALGAFNVNSIESILSVMDASDAMEAPLIVQVSMGARGYVKHLAAFVETIKRFAAEYHKSAIFIQHDHCPSVEDCITAIDAGVQAVMFDGSHLGYEENIRETRRIADYAHERGIWVEAELGRIAGFEDMTFAESTVFTDPGTVADFVQRSGCDALAVAVGTSHGGVVGDDYLPLDAERLSAIIAAIPETPIVLHGGASLPPELIDACNAEGAKVEYLRNCSEESIRKAVSLGVRKVNMDVDNFLVFTTAVRKYMNEHPDKYDPRKYLTEGRKAYQTEVEHKLSDVVCSKGFAKGII